MIHISVQSLQDVADKKPVFEGIALPELTMVHEMHVGILEGGTISGRTSLMFLLKGPNGQQLVAECTARELEALAGAVRGAEERFGK